MGGERSFSMPRPPLWEIVISQTAGGLAFEFLREKDWGTGRLVPAIAKECSIGRLPPKAERMTRSAETLWDIRAAGRSGAVRIEYGVIPAGFWQSYPPGDGPVPPLAPGEYVVSAFVVFEMDDVPSLIHQVFTVAAAN